MCVTTTPPPQHPNPFHLRLLANSPVQERRSDYALQARLAAVAIKTIGRYVMTPAIRESSNCNCNRHAEPVHTDPNETVW